MIRKLLVSSIAATSTFAVLPAVAQTQSGQAAIEEIEVISTSRRSEGLADVNASVSVIGADELDLINPTHHQEALNRLPGVNIHRNNGQESLTAIRSPVLTGAGACGAFMVAENGIPLRSHGFCNVNEMFDAHTENAEQIEVIRGPGSAFWGSNALHGLINVVLPKPGEAGEISLEQGPRGSYRSRAAIGYDHGAFKNILLVNGISEEGYHDNSNYDQQKVSWLYSYDMGDTQLDGGFTVSNLHQETAGYVVGTDAYEDHALKSTNPNPEAFRDNVNGRVWTSLTRQFGDWEVVATPYFREVNMTFMQHFLPGKPIEDTEHRSVGIQIAAYRQLSNGANLAWGLDAEDTDGKLKQFQPNPTTGSFFLRNSIPQGMHYDYDVDAQQFAGFLSYEQNFDNGWELSLGLRLEQVKYDYDNNMIDGRTDQNGVACRFGCRYNRPADSDDEFTDLSPKFGLSRALNDNHSVQIRVQRGIRAPQATELYRLQNAQTIADLDSVELDSLEFGFIGAGDNWDYTASLYFMNKEEDIITNSARENLNGGETEHRGLEIGIGYELSSQWLLRGTFNLADHTYDNEIISGGINIEDKDVDSAPNTFGNLRLAYRPNPQLLAELEYVHMGDYYTNPENTASYDGHDLLNLHAQYEVSDDLSVSLNVLNLTDEEYAGRADWTTFTGDRYFTGQPLRAFIGVDWKFR